MSLRASRLAAACRLRQSCRRDRGPVTLPRSGCPVCRSRHPAALPPLEPFAPQGAGPLLLLRRAARARGSACKRRQGKFPLTPLSARAISAAAFLSPTFSPRSNRIPARKARSSQEPRCVPCTHRPRGLRKLAHAGVVSITLQGNVPETPRNSITNRSQWLFSYSPCFSLAFTLIETYSDHCFVLMAFQPLHSNGEGR